jgi:AcrR family transcriptional regulator
MRQLSQYCLIVAAVHLQIVRPEHAPGAAAVGRIPVRVRVIDGALRCIARQGVAKTTLDDVAREARCSRATVYRAFPGGKEGVLGAVVDTEVSRLFSALAVRMGQATALDEVLVAGMHEAATRVSEHPALAYLLRYEPEVVLPQLAFDRMDEVRGAAAAFIAPFLGRWLDHEEAGRVAEWATRIVISYLACPADGVDLTEPAHVRRLVHTFVLPGIRTGSLTSAAEIADDAATEPRGQARHPNRHKSSKTTKGTKGEAS